MTLFFIFNFYYYFCTKNNETFYKYETLQPFYNNSALPNAVYGWGTGDRD